MQRIRNFLLLLSLYLLCSGHVGSPNIVFEGQAGPYSLLANIQPPEVVPGLAQVSVRITDGTASQVSVQAIYFRYGGDKAPEAEPAKQVSGDATLYASELWLMAHGSSSVKIIVDGEEGRGSTVIPVPALATAQLQMEEGLGIVLAILGLILFIGGATIIGTSTGEATLKHGEAIHAKKRNKAIIVGVSMLFVFSGILYLGKLWWESEESAYERYMYKPVALKASVKQDRIIRLQLEDEGHFDRKAGDLIPDHGKLIHLFMISENDLNTFAHLHPVKFDSVNYDVAVPDLPAGNYHVFADIVHQSGLNETLVTGVSLQEKSVQTASLPVIVAAANEDQTLLPDQDDSWYQYQKPNGNQQSAGGYRMNFEKSTDKKYVVGQVESLKFSLVNENGLPVILEPYLGMLGHAAVVKDDASVFIHLHPAGTISMAAQEMLANKISDDVTLCVVLDSSNYDMSTIQNLSPNQVTSMRQEILKQMKEKGLSNEVSFPYAFPKAGNYRMWVQVQVKGEIVTTAFDIQVDEPILAAN